MRRGFAIALAVFGLALAGWVGFSQRGGSPRAAEAAGPEGEAALARTGAGRVQLTAAGARARGERLAFAAIRAQPKGEARRAALLAWLLELAARDPELATQLAASLGEEDGRVEALHECLPLWLAAAPESARSWLLSQVGSLPAETAESLARDAASIDPEIGFAVAEQVYVGTRAPAMKAVFSAWAVRDPEGAALAVDRLAKVDGYLPALEEIARVWSERDASQAYAWAARLDRPEARRSALLPVIVSWASREPAAAARALEGLPPEALNTRLVDEVATRWGRTDPERAFAWVQSLGDAREREAGTTSLLTELLATDPERAARWANQIAAADEARKPVLDKVMTAWAARDPSRANAWLAAHPSTQP